MLEGPPRHRGIVDAEDQRVLALSRELSNLWIVAVDGERGVRR
jgi:hypothetical protein